MQIAVVGCNLYIFHISLTDYSFTFRIFDFPTIKSNLFSWRDNLKTRSILLLSFLSYHVVFITRYCSCTWYCTCYSAVYTSLFLLLPPLSMASLVLHFVYPISQYYVALVLRTFECRAYSVKLDHINILAIYVPLTSDIHASELYMTVHCHLL